MFRFKGLMFTTIAVSMILLAAFGLLFQAQPISAEGVSVPFAQVDPTPIAPTPATEVNIVPVPQNVDPDVPVLPENLGRISWGAVIAGVILALVIQLALNLLGIAVGTTQLDPHDPDAPSAKALTSTAVFWLGLSTIISLVLGGWVAARFAGIPDNTDGLLHGLMVWGLVTLVTLLLVSSTVGRLLSGVNFLIQRSLDLVGQVTGTLAHGAVNVAQGAAHVAGDVTQKTGQAASDAVSRGAEAVRQQVDEHPEVRQAVQQQTTAHSSIQDEVAKLISDAGVAPQVEATANQAKGQLQNAAQKAAQQAQHGDLDEARQTLVSAVQNVLERGRDTTEQVDRDKVLKLMMSRSNMTREQAEETLNDWETRYHDARQQTDQVRRQVSQQFDRVRTQVRDKVEEVGEEAEEKAREAADQARQALGKVALALFAALVVGAIAAGLGGLLGTPGTLPTAEIDTTALSSFLWF